MRSTNRSTATTFGSRLRLFTSAPRCSPRMPSSATSLGSISTDRGHRQSGLGRRSGTRLRPVAVRHLGDGHPAARPAGSGTPAPKPAAPSFRRSARHRGPSRRCRRAVRCAVALTKRRCSVAAFSLIVVARIGVSCIGGGGDAGGVASSVRLAGLDCGAEGLHDGIVAVAATVQQIEPYLPRCDARHGHADDPLLHPSSTPPGGCRMRSSPPT
jgi:hypothetical protein